MILQPPLLAIGRAMRLIYKFVDAGSGSSMQGSRVRRVQCVNHDCVGKRRIDQRHGVSRTYRQRTRLEKRDARRETREASRRRGRGRGI